MGGNIFVGDQGDGVFKISASNGHLSDFTITNFEVLATAQRVSNLFIASDSLVHFEEVSGAESSTQDTLHIQQLKNCIPYAKEEKLEELLKNF